MSVLSQVLCFGFPILLRSGSLAHSRDPSLRPRILHTECPMSFLNPRRCAVINYAPRSRLIHEKFTHEHQNAFPLPGPFTAYRYKSLLDGPNGNGPLANYFKGKTVHGGTMEAGSAKTAMTSGDAILEDSNNIASRSIVRSNSHNFPTPPPAIQMNRRRIRPRAKTILAPTIS